MKKRETKKETTSAAYQLYLGFYTSGLQKIYTFRGRSLPKLFVKYCVFSIDLNFYYLHWYADRKIVINLILTEQ